MSHLTSYSSSFLDDFFFLSKRVWPCEISSSSVHDITLPWYPVKFTSVIIYQQTCQVFGFFCTGVLEYKLFRSTPKERIFFNFHKTAEEPFDAWIWDDLRRSSEVWYAQTLPGISRGHPHFLQKVNGEYLGGGDEGERCIWWTYIHFPSAYCIYCGRYWKVWWLNVQFFPFCQVVFREIFLLSTEQHEQRKCQSREHLYKDDVLKCAILPPSFYLFILLHYCGIFTNYGLHSS